jgi:hypothetical protein
VEKKQRRQRNQRHRIFREIISHIKEADYIYLFGPGKAKEESKYEIEKSSILKEKAVATGRAYILIQKKMTLLMTNYFNDTLSGNVKRKMRLERKTHCNLSGMQIYFQI